jgi:hypothetical protein
MDAPAPLPTTPSPSRSLSAVTSVPHGTRIIDLSLPPCYAFSISYDWTLIDSSLTTSSPPIMSLDHLLSLISPTQSSSAPTGSIPLSTSTSSIGSISSVNSVNSDSKETTFNGRNGKAIKGVMRRNSKVMNNIGYAYLHGLFGIPRNACKAVEWFKKSAAEKDEFGCFNLGCMLRDGVTIIKSNSMHFNCSSLVVRCFTGEIDWNRM